MSTTRYYVVRSFCVVVLSALAFGTRQAAAGSTPMFVGDYCDPSYYPDSAACLEVCKAAHGPGTQAICASYNPQLPNGYPTCQCIL